MKHKPVLERFWDKVKKDGPEECWEWQAFRLPFGYGTFAPHVKMCLAHRFSWTLVHGPIPEGLLVLHRCDNPPCVNPAHLFLGTNKDNSQDRVRKGRSRSTRIATGEPINAKITTAQVYEIRLRAEVGESSSHLAHEFGVKRHAISNIIYRRTWKHLSASASET